MVDVFVAFIRVVYGRTIYMSLPFTHIKNVELYFFYRVRIEQVYTCILHSLFNYCCFDAV